MGEPAATAAHGLAGLGATADETEILGALIDNLDRYAAAELDSRAIDRDHAIPRGIIDDLAEMGLFGLSIPEEHGGFGLSMQGVCSAIAALARHDRSVAVTAGLHLGLGTRGLVRYGSPHLQSTYLPALAAGERIASFATTEAGAGSDLTAVRVRAAPDGDHVRVDGEKIFVTNGGFADVYTITAFSPELGGGRRGHSMVVLERGDDGVEPGAEEDKLGMRGSSTITLHLDGVRVPGDRLLGTAGQGMAQLSHVLTWGRTVMAAGCAGASRAALDMAVDQVTRRVQFGQAIGRFDVVREQVADMAALVFTSDALVRYTAAVEDDDARLMARSTSAKVFCSDESWWAVDTALQLHGGSGYIEETGVALLLRDSRISRIWEGANDVLLAHLGTMEAMVRARPEPLSDRVSAPTRELAGRADELVDMATGVREEVRARLGIRVMRRQQELHRLGHLAMLRDATEAAVLRADAEGTEEARLLAAHWLDMARARLGPLVDAPADADVIAAISDQLYEGRLP